MIKILTTLLFFALIFTACEERGLSLTPKNIQHKPIEKKINALATNAKVHTTKKKHKPVQVNITPKTSDNTLVQKAQANTSKSLSKEKVCQTSHDTFTLSDDTKNKISGFFIFLIGLMIFI